MKNPDLLFEIGCEELPATSLADIFESSTPTENVFAEKFKKLLTEKRLSFKTCEVWATPRRLVFHVTEVPQVQEARDQMTKIFSKDDAYSTDGKPTEKFLTILKHRGATPEDTVIADFNGKPFAFIRKAEACEKTVDILPAIFEALIKSLNFPKNMKWDDSGILFSRPIRRYLAIYGEEPLHFKIGHVTSESATGIFLKGQRIREAVKNIPSYFDALKKHGVILNQVERKKVIAQQLERLAASSSLRIYEDPFLLNEVNYLVEMPYSLVAPFGTEFLTLPLEVLAVSMARKQRIFGLVDAGGSLVSKLVAVLDGARSASETEIISKNIENILHAKLQDSLFFFREDIKGDVKKKRDELKNLVFLKGAGSMLEKSDRLVRLAQKIEINPPLLPDVAHGLERAAYLCKADLLTQMVGEFPELQGIMGKYYALESGQPDRRIAEAIGEQYLPRTVSDPPPASLGGSLLSMLDKTDLIVASFGLGLEPTSSMDPYGLRRSASAIFKIILDKKIDISFKKLVDQARVELGSFILKDKEVALPAKLDAFFKDRFKAVLADRGLQEDLVDAVMASGFDRPYEVFERTQALSGLLKNEAFQKSCKVVERTANILKGNKEPYPSAIESGSLVEPLEIELFSQYEKHRAEILGSTQKRDYALATNLYAEAFSDILERFFEKVFINTDDLKVRMNRLLLLKTIKELYTQNIAELSKIRL